LPGRVCPSAEAWLSGVIMFSILSVAWCDGSCTRCPQEVRGSSQVTDQNPEGKFEALAQYARDLTQAAREGKLDPVIGRDEQIRRVDFTGDPPLSYLNARPVHRWTQRSCTLLLPSEA